MPFRFDTLRKRHYRYFMVYNTKGSLLDIYQNIGNLPKLPKPLG